MFALIIFILFILIFMVKNIMIIRGVLFMSSGNFIGLLPERVKLYLAQSLSGELEEQKDRTFTSLPKKD